MSISMSQFSQASKEDCFIVAETSMDAWFRETMIAAFDDKESRDRQQRLTLGRQRAEFQQQDARLLDAYLAGHIDKATFQDRTTELKGRLRELNTAFGGVNTDADSVSRGHGEDEYPAMQGLGGDMMQGHSESVQGHDHGHATDHIRCRDIDPSCRDMAVRVFDFTQRAGEIWRGSKIGRKQRILRAVSLNRTLNDASVEITKRKPLDLLPNPTAVSSSRGDWIRTSDLLTPSQARYPSCATPRVGRGRTAERCTISCMRPFHHQAISLVASDDRLVKQHFFRSRAHRRQLPCRPCETAQLPQSGPAGRAYNVLGT